MVTLIGKSMYNNSLIVKLIIIFVDTKERRNERVELGSYLSNKLDTRAYAL